MSDIEKLNMMYKQMNSTKNNKTKNQLQRGIYKLEKKIKQEKLGMKRKDNIYYQ